MWARRFNRIIFLSSPFDFTSFSPRSHIIFDESVAFFIIFLSYTYSVFYMRVLLYKRYYSGCHWRELITLIIHVNKLTLETTFMLLATTTEGFSYSTHLPHLPNFSAQSVCHFVLAWIAISFKYVVNAPHFHQISKGIINEINLQTLIFSYLWQINISR